MIDNILKEIVKESNIFFDKWSLEVSNHIFEVNLSRLFRNLIHVPFNHLLQLLTPTNILLMQPIF